jgi:hypothetical protein
MDSETLLDDPRLSQSGKFGFVKEFEYPDPDSPGGFVNFVKQFQWPNQDDAVSGFLNLSGESVQVKSSYTSRITAANRKDCAFLSTLESQIKSDKNSAQAQLIGAKKAKDKKDIQDKLDGMDQALTEVRKAMDSAQCSAGSAGPDINKYLDDLKNVGGSKTTGYIIWGSVGLVALVSIVVIIKKLRKK